MARRFSSRARLVSAGRKTFWLGGVVTKTLLSSASQAALLTTLNAAALALRPFTIVRTRGWWSFLTDNVTASEDQVAHYGEIVVSDQAVAIGVTAVPTPATDNQSGFHVYDSAAQSSSLLSSVGLNPDMQPHRYQFDSKAMRKVEEGQDLISVVETDALSLGLSVFTFSRTLIKLH